MEKKVVYVIFVMLILLGIFITIKFGPSITTGSVVQKEKCVIPEEANSLIENFDCQKIDYINCNQNFVAVKCP